LASSCKLFRPIDPNAPAKAAPSPAPAATAGTTKTATSTKAAPAPKQLTAREQRAGLSDPSIAAMVLAANNTDISYARVALAPTRENSATRAERPEVRAFAQRMLTDHTGVNGLVNDLLSKLNVTPVENTASLDFRDESANKRDAMRDLSGYPFDSTYIENEVAYHIKFLATIDSVLIPAARNKDLKALLTAVRPAVAAHLAHAEQVRANVRSKK
jgi:putative membrane protein